MEDDDEFGDLYTDVLTGASAPPPPFLIPSSSSPKPSPDPLLGIDDDDDDDDDQILFGASRSNPPASSSSRPPQTLAPNLEGDGEDDWLLGRGSVAVEQPENWVEEEDEGVARASNVSDSDFPEEDHPRVLEEVEKEEKLVSETTENVKDAVGEGSRVLEDDEDALLGGGAWGKLEIGGSDQEPAIPGLSAGPLPPVSLPGMSGRDTKASRSDDWDSDSEDDLQIVLNDNNHGRLGGERNEGVGSDDEDDEDGEEDLVIVTDGDQHHHQQGMEEQEWGEGSMQATIDGEGKEITDAAKGNSAIGGVAGARIGYSNHGFHMQHHSMFKYIRPGAPPVPGGSVVGAVGAPGQFRPPITTGPIAGRGRGDWRPAGGRSLSTTQKNFHSGYGLPIWANNSSARPFGSGLDFTLPSHKTVFDIDIDTFEEKPWRHLGVDISDFFNFGLDEDNWKDYCKQLDQLRLEASMQSKIRVYESGRSEQEYDPDLPPELAAAAGLHDVSVENMHNGKAESGQADLNGQGRGMARPQLPTGRAIQVEGGFGERLPSIDTRPPRIRDSDAIIEIVLQDSLDDSTTSNGALEQPENDPQSEDLKGVHEVEEDDRRAESYSDRFPHSVSARKREMGPRRVPFLPEGDGILPFPSEEPLQYHPNPKLRGPVYPSGPFRSHHGRLPQGRYSNTSGEHSNDVIPSQSAKVNRHDEHQKENSGDSMEGNQTSEVSPDVAVETAGEQSIEQRDYENDDRLALGDSVEVEAEDMVSDLRISSETLDDDTLVHSTKKQKLSSRVEQPAIEDQANGDDLRTTNSDNGRAKSGSSKDYQRRIEGGEEVIQDDRSRRMGDLRRRHEEEEHSLRRKNDYVRNDRHEIDRIRTASRGREDLYHSYPHRDWDSNSAHPARGRSEGFERPKERDGSIGIWQRREDDIHSRRIKEEDTRRERGEDIGARQRNKVRVNDRNDKDEDLHSRKRLDDGDWRGRDKDGGPRQREKSDSLMSRRENFDREKSDGLMSRRENLDDLSKRRKDEEQPRREKVDKEDPLHGYRIREDTSRRKREREKDDGADHRRREDISRVRDKPEDHLSARHRDDSWRQREREDRQRLKQSHEDVKTYREREEGRGAVRSGRVLEDKPFGGNGRTKDESKGLGSDKDYQHKDRRRHDEQPKRGDRAGEENTSQHKGREDVHAREKQFNNEERSSRHERLSIHNDRPSSASDSQQLHREKHRETTRKNKDTEGGEQNPQGPGRRKHDDHNTHRNEKVSTKGANEQESNNISSAPLPKKGHQHIQEQSDAPHLHHSGKHGEEDAASDDENQLDSRRGRSKLERWTSHKEREYIANNDKMQSLPSSSRGAMEVEGGTANVAQPHESAKTEGNMAGDSDPKDADAGQISDRTGEDRDRHLDTVAKLKKRSERFKLPMPGEKDTVVNKKVENEAQLNPNEIAADAEIKQERPARKRRWISG